MAMVEPQMKLDLEEIKKKPIEKLSLEEAQLLLKDLSEHKSIKDKVVNLGDLKATDLVKVFVPKSSLNDIFHINGQPYFGEMVIPFAIAQQLEYMVSEERDMAKQRMISRNKERGQNTVNLYSPEGGLQIRKFQEIVNQGGN